MNKKKQASIDRKNRIRTRRLEKAAKDERRRRHLMMDLSKLEELAADQDAEAARG